jgi:CO/xanthine dehydrogenase Mo-binding subunit
VVDVDPDLGLVKVVQVATAQDVGRALNPLSVLGQIEGGIAQGLGLAVMEEIVVEDGRIRNPSFTDYLLPTASMRPTSSPLSSRSPIRRRRSGPRASASRRASP